MSKSKIASKLNSIIQNNANIFIASAGAVNSDGTVNVTKPGGQSVIAIASPTLRSGQCIVVKAENGKYYAMSQGEFKEETTDVHLFRRRRGVKPLIAASIAILFSIEDSTHFTFYVGGLSAKPKEVYKVEKTNIFRLAFFQGFVTNLGNGKFSVSLAFHGDDGNNSFLVQIKSEITNYFDIDKIIYDIPGNDGSSNIVFTRYFEYAGNLMWSCPVLLTAITTQETSSYSDSQGDGIGGCNAGSSGIYTIPLQKKGSDEFVQGTYSESRQGTSELYCIVLSSSTNDNYSRSARNFVFNNSGVLKSVSQESFTQSSSFGDQGSGRLSSTKKITYKSYLNKFTDKINEINNLSDYVLNEIRIPISSTEKIDMNVRETVFNGIDCFISEKISYTYTKELTSNDNDLVNNAQLSLSRKNTYFLHKKNIETEIKFDPIFVFFKLNSPPIIEEGVEIIVPQIRIPPKFKYYQLGNNAFRPEPMDINIYNNHPIYISKYVAKDSYLLAEGNIKNIRITNSDNFDSFLGEATIMVTKVYKKKYVSLSDPRISSKSLVISRTGTFSDFLSMIASSSENDENNLIDESIYFANRKNFPSNDARDVFVFNTFYSSVENQRVAHSNFFKDSFYCSTVGDEVKEKDTIGCAERWKIDKGSIILDKKDYQCKVFSLKNKDAVIHATSYHS